MPAQSEAQRKYLNMRFGHDQCSKCGSDKRYAKGLCKRCYSREWYRKKPGRMSASDAKKGFRNPNWKGGISLESKLAYFKAWRKNKEEYIRDKEYQKRFGITLAEYNEMLIRQGGVCAICESSPGRRRLEVDHCHATGKVRGLLCEICNRALGHFQDSPKIFRSAAEYLERSYASQESSTKSLP